MSTAATLTSDLVCTVVGECAAGQQYEVTPKTATSNRVCGECKTCLPGTYRRFCTDGVRDATCQPCPDDQFSSTNNALFCLPYAPNCTTGYTQTAAPTPTNDRACTAQAFAIELISSTVLAMAFRALALNLTAQVRCVVVFFLFVLFFFSL